MFVMTLDDDPVQRKMISAWLVPMGFSVLEADTVPNALQLLAEHEPVMLCIVDWHMHPLERCVVHCCSAARASLR